MQHLELDRHSTNRLHDLCAMVAICLPFLGQYVVIRWS